MFIRFALYLLYIIVPFAIALIAYFSVTLSDRNQTSIYYILSTSKLINPEIIFYRNPNDVLFKSTTYLSDDILNLLESQGYLEKSDIKYDFSEFKECNKYKIEKQELDKNTVDEVRLVFLIENFKETNLENFNNCIYKFVNHLNYVLFLKYDRIKILERIDNNLLDIDYYINTKKTFLSIDDFFIRKRIRTILNTMIITEQVIVSSMKSLNVNEKEFSELNELLDVLDKQKGIFRLFESDLDKNSILSEEGTIDDFNDKLEIQDVYLINLKNNLNVIKKNIIENNSKLLVVDSKIVGKKNNSNSLYSPGFALFVLLLSTLFIILIESIYRRFSKQIF